MGEINNGPATAARRAFSFSQLYVNLEAGWEDVRAKTAQIGRKTVDSGMDDVKVQKLLLSGDRDE